MVHHAGSALVARRPGRAAGSAARAQKHAAYPTRILVAFGIAALLGAGLWLFNRDSREDLTLADVTASSRESGYASEALGGLRDRTGTLCEGVEGCAEVYASSEVELFRFETKDAARDFASSAGDVYVSDWIVIVYLDASLSARGKAALETLVDELWTSD